MGWGERKDRVQCEVHANHVDVDRARQRISAMPTHELCEWATNVAIDLQKLVDMVKQGDTDAVEMLQLCDAMMHACVAEITGRRKKT